MNPPSTQAAAVARTTESRDAMAFALTRLWPVLGIERETPQGRAVEAALLEPARSMLDRAGKRFRGHLVELCWQLAGGVGRCPDALPAVIEVIHAGSLIIDDIEDGSTERRGAPTVHRLFGVPLALNAGNWLYFWALELLGEMDLPAHVALDLHRRLGRMLVQGHAGQALDIDANVERLAQGLVPEHVAHLSRLKTGSFVGLAAAVGAVSAQASAPVVDAVERFGLALGGGLQMLDDLGNLVGRRQGAKRHEDLRHGRATWIWAWYAEVATPREWRDAMRRLRDVRAGTEDADVLASFLLARVGLHGRQRVRQVLSIGFESLRHATGPHPLLAAFCAEIERLENSYV